MKQHLIAGMLLMMACPVFADQATLSSFDTWQGTSAELVSQPELDISNNPSYIEAYYDDVIGVRVALLADGKTAEVQLYNGAIERISIAKTYYKPGEPDYAGYESFAADYKITFPAGSLDTSIEWLGQGGRIDSSGTIDGQEFSDELDGESFPTPDELKETVPNTPQGRKQYAYKLLMRTLYGYFINHSDK